MTHATGLEIALERNLSTRARAVLALAVPYLLSLPMVAVIGGLFLYPVLRIIAGSLFPGDLAGGPSLAGIITVVSDPYYQGLMLRTLRVSVIATVVSLIIAFPVALCMRQAGPRERAIITFIMLSPLLTSVVVRTLAWVLLLSPRGVLNEFLAVFGVGPFNILYTETAVIIGLVHVYLGYMVLSLMISLLKLDDPLIEAAQCLGASRWRILKEVVWPLSLPGAINGSILVFTMCASTYATPALLGGHQGKVLATEIYDLSVVHLDFAEAGMVATVLFVFVCAVVWGAAIFANTGSRRAIFK